MGYRSLLVHLELGRSNIHLLQVAGELAQRFDARVIGIAACAPPVLIYGDVALAGDACEMERAEIELQIEEAEAEFRGGR